MATDIHIDHPILPPIPKRPKNKSKPPKPLPSPNSPGPSASSIPCSPNTPLNQWVKGTYEPLDVTNILGSPHQIPKGFKEWLLTFLGEDATLVEDHLKKILGPLKLMTSMRMFG